MFKTILLASVAIFLLFGSPPATFNDIRRYAALNNTTEMTNNPIPAQVLVGTGSSAITALDKQPRGSLNVCSADPFIFRDPATYIGKTRSSQIESFEKEIDGYGNTNKAYKGFRDIKKDLDTHKFAKDKGFEINCQRLDALLNSGINAYDTLFADADIQEYYEKKLPLDTDDVRILGNQFVDKRNEEYINKIKKFSKYVLNQMTQNEAKPSISRRTVNHAKNFFSWLFHSSKQNSEVHNEPESEKEKKKKLYTTLRNRYTAIIADFVHLAKLSKTGAAGYNWEEINKTLERIKANHYKKTRHEHDQMYNDQQKSNNIIHDQRSLPKTDESVILAAQESQKPETPEQINEPQIIQEHSSTETRPQTIPSSPGIEEQKSRKTISHEEPSSPSNKEKETAKVISPEKLSGPSNKEKKSLEVISPEEQNNTKREDQNAIEVIPHVTQATTAFVEPTSVASKKTDITNKVMTQNEATTAKTAQNTENTPKIQQKEKGHSSDGSTASLVGDALRITQRNGKMPEPYTNLEHEQVNKHESEGGKNTPSKLDSRTNSQNKNESAFLNGGKTGGTKDLYEDAEINTNDSLQNDIQSRNGPDTFEQSSNFDNKQSNSDSSKEEKRTGSKTKEDKHVEVVQNVTSRQTNAGDLDLTVNGSNKGSKAQEMPERVLDNLISINGAQDETTKSQSIIENALPHDYSGVDDIRDNLVNSSINHKINTKAMMYQKSELPAGANVIADIQSGLNTLTNPTFSQNAVPQVPLKSFDAGIHNAHGNITAPVSAPQTMNAPQTILQDGQTIAPQIVSGGSAPPPPLPEVPSAIIPENAPSSVPGVVGSGLGYVGSGLGYVGSCIAAIPSLIPWNWVYLAMPFHRQIAEYVKYAYNKGKRFLPFINNENDNTNLKDVSDVNVNQDKSSANKTGTDNAEQVKKTTVEKGKNQMISDNDASAAMKQNDAKTKETRTDNKSFFAKLKNFVSKHKLAILVSSLSLVSIVVIAWVIKVKET